MIKEFSTASPYLTLFGLIGSLFFLSIGRQSGQPIGLASGIRTGSDVVTTQTRKPTRRALLIGIENYEHQSQFRSGGCDEATRKPVMVPAARRKGEGEGFANLAGTINDVCAVQKLLNARFGFDPGNIHVLVEKDATHDAILSALKRYLIDEAQPGDICLFFYSGHGSQIRNTRGGEDDQLDETIVPIDWQRPITKRQDVKDIRDKELYKLFREASKKVTLTALFDSCHSGGISRGGVTTGGNAKTGPAELKFDLAESPPDEEQKTESDQEYLERNGVLVITAARDDQKAEENDYGEVGREPQRRGNFTYSLVEVLRSPNADNLSVAHIFDRLVVQMKSHKVPHDPVVFGSASRRRLSLFGEPVDPSKRPETNVVRVDETGQITLQGGLAMGFNEGCEFIKKEDAGKPGAVRVRISRTPDYVKSVAEVIAETSAKLRIARTIRPNDVFILDKWAAPDEPNLVVWIPPAKLKGPELLAAAREIEKLGGSAKVQLVADPTAEVASHFLFHDGANWQLKLPDNQIVSLGAVLTAKTVLDNLPASGGKATLFYSLPPSMELAADIKLGAGTQNSAIAVAKSPAQAHYWLVGRARSDATLEYSWLLPDATVGVAQVGELSATKIKAANTGVSPLPPITDWKTKSTDLEDLALRLGRIRGWVKLESPQGDSGFAYHLVLKNKAGEVLSPANATLEDGEQLALWLVADENRLQSAPQQRHVYIFDIDGSGTATLLYPDIANAADAAFPYVSGSNDQPPKREQEIARLKICGPDVKASCAGDSRCPCQSPSPLGPETYVMLTTPKDEPLPDPLVLESAGVRTTQGSSRGRGSSPLQDLLTNIGSTSRGNRPVAPVNWSVEQVFFRSVPKKK